VLATRLGADPYVLYHAVDVAAGRRWGNAAETRKWTMAAETCGREAEAAVAAAEAPASVESFRWRWLGRAPA